GERAQDDLGVVPERPVGGVQVVGLDHLGQWRPRWPEYLPHARHARRERLAIAVASLDQLVLVGDQRARPDEAHLTLEHVDELRQLVQRASPQQLAYARDTRIVVELEQSDRLVELAQRRRLGGGRGGRRG